MPSRKRARPITTLSDMGEYTDEKGETYILDPEWTTGEIVILSDDKSAWRLKRSVLHDASPVFRDLFATASSDTNEVNLPDATRDNLDIFVRTLCLKDPPTGLTVAQTGKAIDLLCQYECLDAAKRLLYANVKSVEAEHLFPAFVLASRLNDVMTACRILAQGHKSYDSMDITYATLCPDSIHSPWSVAEASQISSGWMWALSLAFTKSDNRQREAQNSSKPKFLCDDPTYWSNIVGTFVCNLNR